MGKADGTYSNQLLLNFKSWEINLFVYVFKQKALGTYGSGGTAPQDLDFGTRLEVIDQHGTGIFYNNDIY
jgi:hypothetical protein